MAVVLAMRIAALTREFLLLLADIVKMPRVLSLALQLAYAACSMLLCIIHCLIVSCVLLLWLP